MQSPLKKARWRVRDYSRLDGSSGDPQDIEMARGLLRGEDWGAVLTARFAKSIFLDLFRLIGTKMWDTQYLFNQIL
jgi:hypothetical protein